MAEWLTSVGLDVGTTTTQLIVSRLRVENRASAFAVPELEIQERQVVYRSPVWLTPMADRQRVDGEALRALVLEAYDRAGITRDAVDTGAVIITGETSRKENAAAVLKSLSDHAGEFVVATAGPDLEAVLAAKGAGAVAWSAETGKPVLHFDIGGGTSNWALVEDGTITATGCLNVGGRLAKWDAQGRITGVSPVLNGLWNQKPGDRIRESDVRQLAELLVRGLEMAAGRIPATELLDRLATREAAGPVRAPVPSGMVLSFSGGVADCIETDRPWMEFGDLGPVLGRAIRESALCRGPYRLGTETIRATVIGAGCHSAQLSGSTIFCRNVELPLKNLTVVAEAGALARLDGPGILALPGMESPSYPQVRELARTLASEISGPMYVALEADMAKALGHALALTLPGDRPILCIDRVGLKPGDYLDVGTPVGPALPVVVKTLVLQR